MTDSPSWSVDLPGLTRQQADAVVRWAREEYDLSGSAVDPAEWLTVHLDADTVRAVAEAASSDPTGSEITAAMAETMGEWLDTNQKSRRA